MRFARRSGPQRPDRDVEGSEAAGLERDGDDPAVARRAGADGELRRSGRWCEQSRPDGNGEERPHAPLTVLAIRKFRLSECVLGQRRQALPDDRGELEGVS